MPRPSLCQERLSSIQSGTGSQMTMTTTTTRTPCTTSGTLPGRSVCTGLGTRHLAPSPLPLPTALRPGMTPLGAEMSVTCPWSHNLQAAEQRFEPEEVWFPNPYSLPVCYVPLRHTSTLVVQALGRPWGAKPTRSCPQDVYSQWEATTDITRGKNAVTEKTRCSDSTEIWMRRRRRGNGVGRPRSSFKALPPSQPLSTASNWTECVTCHPAL